MTDRRTQLLTYLAQNEGWITSSQLADRLGVTTRSVRSYITAAKSAAAPLDIISSSADGYRLNRAAYDAFLHSGNRRAEPETPRERLYHVVRKLLDAPVGLDVYDLAAELFVSESTIGMTRGAAGRAPTSTRELPRSRPGRRASRAAQRRLRRSSRCSRPPRPRRRSPATASSRRSPTPPTLRRS